MDSSIIVKKRRIKAGDAVLTLMVNFSALVSILLLIGIVGYVFYRGIGVINWSFLTKVPSTINGTFGIAGNIVN